MHIEPAYTSVGKLFEYRPMFSIIGMRGSYLRLRCPGNSSASAFCRNLLA